jgi:hypothetical protein
VKTNFSLPFLLLINIKFLFITLQSEYGLTEEQVAGEFNINFISPCLDLIWNTREGNLPGAKVFAPNHEKAYNIFFWQIQQNFFLSYFRTHKSDEVVKNLWI